MAATSPSPTPNTTIAEQRPSPAQRILVMVDNRALQRALLRLCSSEGYEVEIVADDLVGLQMLRKSPPSALILDLKYPASLRWKLCREIARSAPDVPFVILSTNSDIKDQDFVARNRSGRLYASTPSTMGAFGASPLCHKACDGASRTRIYAFENVLVDFVRMEVTRGGEKVALQQRNPKRWSS